MRLDLFRCITLIRVRLENLIDQINALWRQSLWHLELATKNLLIELSRGFVFKWQVAGNHGKKNDTTGPYIDTGAVVLQSIDHLRCCVAGRATRRLEELSLLVSVTQAEVDEPYVFLMVQKQVFRFQVSVDDAQLVQVLNTTDDLLEELACFRLFQLLLLDDVVKKFASTHKLHDQEELLWRLNNLEELNDVRVPNQL